MAWGVIADVAATLEEPPEGSQQVRGHDKTYGEIRDGFDAVRDACNDGLNKVNGWLEQAGRSERLPTLTEDSLDEYVVFPLSGNYYRIQQNGSACKILKDGMNVWGNNFASLIVNSELAFQGQTKVAFVGQLGAYSLVMKGVGAVMSSGSTVFDSIATVSERIAIQVEKTLIEMGKRLLKLAKVVGKRFLGGWISVAALIKDLAQHGLSVITDVVDDVKWCITAIDKCFSLKDEVEAWAQTQADRLEAFKEIVDIVNQLPFVDIGTPLQDVEVPDLGDISDLLADIDPDFTQSEEGQAAEGEVDDAGDDLVTGSGYIHPSWLEACIPPPYGMAHLPYIPGDPNLDIPRNPITGEPDPNLSEMEPPVPGVSSKHYYQLYENWRHALRPPLYAPPAEGKPRGA